jgi:hypothetical protein
MLILLPDKNNVKFFGASSEKSLQPRIVQKQSSVALALLMMLLSHCLKTGIYN